MARKARRKGILLNRDEVSELLGVTVSTVSRWVKLGMPVAGLDSDSDSQLFNSSEVIDWKIKQETETVRSMYKSFGNDDAKHIPMAEAKRRKEVAAMMKAELELAEAMGKVANIDDILSEVADVFSNVRAKLISRSSRLSGLLAHLPEDEIAKIIEEDTEETLKELSDYEVNRRN